MIKGDYNKSHKRFFSIVLFSLLAFNFSLLGSCSFDYGPTGDAEKGKPDIVMENIDYVRVRSADPQVRFHAEYAERWEDRQVMELRNFSFEQLENRGGTVNADGSAGAAVVRLESGDVAFRDGVIINIESEDITIITEELEWRDEERLLFSSDDAEVGIERSDGTSFTGRGFSAHARNRTWAFSGMVQGIFVDEDDNEEDPTVLTEESTDGDDAAEERPGTELRQPLPGRRIAN